MHNFTNVPRNLHVHVHVLSLLDLCGLGTSGMCPKLSTTTTAAATKANLDIPEVDQNTIDNMGKKHNQNTCMYENIHRFCKVLQTVIDNIYIDKKKINADFVRQLFPIHI